MTPISFAKRCHPCPSELGDALFVTVIILLVSPSRFPLEWRFCPAQGIAAVIPWQASQWGQGSDLCGLVLLGMNEKLLYRTIKHDKMGWVCLGTLWTNCTGKCHIFFSLCECSDNKLAISS